jgi:hypothetical protein
MDKKLSRNKDIDPQIKSNYDLIMKDCPKLIPSQWEMEGEYFKQFSLYETYYDTKVTNCV